MPPTARIAGRREWIGLAVLALPCVVYAMDLTVLNLAIPALSADLDPSSTQLLWIVDVYGFVVAGALITMGALGDRIGGRRLLLIGAAAFATASLLAAFATSAGLLIAARALLGLAGATIAPSTLSLITAMFADPRQRTVAIGVWVTSYSAGAAIGPLAGGAVLQVAWWGAVFLLGVPVMFLLLIAGPRLLPEPATSGAGRLDLRSAVLSVAATLAVVAGLKQAAAHGVGAEALALVAAGIALGTVFLRRQRRLAEPLIDLSLFRTPVFSVALATNLVAFFVVFGMALFVAQYLQSVLGLSPLAAGLWSAPEALGFVAGSTLAPRVIGRWGQAAVIGVGTAVGAAGWLLVAGGGLGPVVLGSTAAAVGLGAVVTLVTDVAVGAAAPAQAGAAAATAETSSELGGALGIAVLGSIGTAIYGPGETLGAAVTGPHAGAARAAFKDAFAVTASISAALLLGAAVVAWLLLRPSALPDPVDPARDEVGAPHLLRAEGRLDPLLLGEHAGLVGEPGRGR